MFDWQNLEPNVPTHPRLEDVVHCGMSWNVPRYDQPPHARLKANHGKSNAEVVIKDILPRARTGNLQATVDDLTVQSIWTANARAAGGSGPLNAYERAFAGVDMLVVFKRALEIGKAVKKPTGCAPARQFTVPAAPSSWRPLV